MKFLYKNNERDPGTIYSMDLLRRCTESMDRFMGKFDHPLGSLYKWAGTAEIGQSKTEGCETLTRLS